jgi:MSHA pilin protein MshD
MSTRLSRGVTLVELIVFIVIVGVAMAGLFAAFNTITAASADPQVRKQALAIAESLMDEVALMPFTFCDPDDANAASAISSAGCAVGTNSEDILPLGPEGGEDRYGTTAPYDNVSDYNTFTLLAPPGIKDINGNVIIGLEGYSAAITVSQAGLASGVDAISTADALKISVTVNGPGGVTTTLEGYRTRYAPTTAP